MRHVRTIAVAVVGGIVLALGIALIVLPGPAYLVIPAGLAILAIEFAWSSSPLKKPPGEGTGPTMHADIRGNLVGRVPSRGERDVFQQTARPHTARPSRRRFSIPSTRFCKFQGPTMDARHRCWIVVQNLN